MTLRASRSRRITRLASIATIAAFAATIAGCSSDPASSTDVTLWGITSDQEEILDPSLADWNSANSDSPIAASFFEGEAYKTKIRTALGAGAGPTLIYNKGGGILDSYVEAGKVVDLTSEFAGTSEGFLPFALEPATVDGALYAIPMKAVAPVVMYYNEDVLDSVGLTPPTTWDELLEAVTVLRDADIAPFALAGGSKWPELMWQEYLVDRIGGPEVFDAILAGEDDAWSHPAILEANTLIQDLVEAGGFADGFSSVTTDSSADAALLYTGKAAMLLQGTWVNSTFRSQAPEFADSSLGYGTFPSVEGGVGDVANIVGNPTSYFSVSADASPQQQASAIEYLKSGLWDDAFVDRLVTANQVPPLVGIDDKIAESEDATFSGLVYELISEAPNFQMSWDQALEPAQSQALLTNLDRLFTLAITPEEFSEAMNKDAGA